MQRVAELSMLILMRNSSIGLSCVSIDSMQYVLSDIGFEKYVYLAKVLRGIENIVCHEREICLSNNRRTYFDLSRGNEAEIALSNAINQVDYQGNFCCHGSFMRGCVP